MKVPKGFAWFVGACLVGIVICFGLSSDAPTIAGHNGWKVAGIACAAVTLVGLGWLVVKSGGK